MGIPMSVMFIIISVIVLFILHLNHTIDAKKFVANLGVFREKKEREIVINLPLYIGLVTLDIGLEKGSIIKSSDEITAGSSTANSPVTLQNLNIEFSHSTADTRVIDAFSPIHFEGGSVTTSGSTKTTIAVALNNSTAGSVIKDVNFSGMVCAVNISTPDFTLDNCVAEEGSKFYLDVMYVDGQSNFIDCLGLLEIYEPNTTSDESEQQAIIAKIHETSPRLVVKFVDA